MTPQETKQNVHDDATTTGVVNLGLALGHYSERLLVLEKMVHTNQLGADRLRPHVAELVNCVYELATQLRMEDSHVLFFHIGDNQFDRHGASEGQMCRTLAALNIHLTPILVNTNFKSEKFKFTIQTIIRRLDRIHIGLARRLIARDPIYPLMEKIQSALTRDWPAGSLTGQDKHKTMNEAGTSLGRERLRGVAKHAVSILLLLKDVPTALGEASTFFFHFREGRTITGQLSDVTTLLDEMIPVCRIVDQLFDAKSTKDRHERLSLSHLARLRLAALEFEFNYDVAVANAHSDGVEYDFNDLSFPPSAASTESKNAKSVENRCQVQTTPSSGSKQSLEQSHQQQQKVNCAAPVAAAS
jgi:hypothetical protein